MCFPRVLRWKKKWQERAQAPSPSDKNKYMFLFNECMYGSMENEGVEGADRVKQNTTQILKCEDSAKTRRYSVANAFFPPFTSQSKRENLPLM